MYGACLAGDASTACLIMELVPGGSLAARIYDRHKRRMGYLEILQVPPWCLLQVSWFELLLLAP